MEYVIFSKRQQRMQDKIPDTDQDEAIPSELRVQVLYIWEKVWGKAHYNDYFGMFDLSELARNVYNWIEMTLREAYGVLSLDADDDPDEDGYDIYRVVRKFLLETEDIGKVIDIIEVSFRYIDQVIRDKFYGPNDDELDEIFGISRPDIPHDGISPDEAINQLNQRFREHNVWYKYESGQIVKVDSPDSHSEVVKPAEELPNNTQQAVNRDAMNNENKKIFIGHGGSDIWKVLRDFIVDTLGLEYEEFNRVSAAGEFIGDRLEEMLDKSCMAFLIMTGEDEQADGSLRARENVVHEVGLFQGRLGFKKAIVLLEEDCKEFSNIRGIGQIRFPKGNIREAFENIIRVLKRESMI